MLQRLFTYIGASQQWVVPDNIDTATPVKLTLRGAGGPTPRGGAGGRVVGTISSFAPGDRWFVYVGGCGRLHVGGTGGAGGFNGGGPGGDSSNGTGGDGGSGATDVRLPFGYIPTLGSRLAVAAGGGAAGTNGNEGTLGGVGGAGAAGTGANGGNGQDSSVSPGGHGGHGGTQTAGGAGGTGGSPVADGYPGDLGVGGSGSNHATPHFVSGGGGGGGLFGGGGGEGGGSGTASKQPAAGGGAAGSNYVGGLDTVISNDSAGSPPRSAGTALLEYNARPDQPALQTPSAQAYEDVTQPVVTTWLFSDPDPGDLQAAADIRWRSGDGAAWTVIAAAATVGQMYTFPAHTFDAYVMQRIEWQVRTQDSYGAWSDWSASSYFTVVPAAPVPTLTLDEPITSRTPLLTVDSTGGDAAYLQARLLADAAGVPGAVLLTSPVAFPDGGTHVTYTFDAHLVMVPGQTYHVQVRVALWAGCWSSWVDSGPVLADLNAPNAPTLTATPASESASVLVAITNPTPDAHPAIFNRVFRQDLTHATPEVLVADQLDPGAAWTDVWPPLNAELRYRVEAVSTEGTYTSSA